MQCNMSKGRPDSHHATPVAIPPVIKYGIEHNAPKNSPNEPDTTAQIIIESFFLSSPATKINICHTYKYITHQIPKPKINPSSKQNMYEAIIACLVEKRIVYMINKNDTISILGKGAMTN